MAHAPRERELLHGDTRMIDTHNHLLPGVDDGPRDLEESLRMCRIAAEDGIRSVAATPHCFDGRFLTSPETVKRLVAQMNEEMVSSGIPLTIVPGMEVRIVPELPELLAEGKVLTINDGRYVLLEFHPSQVPAGFANLVRRLVGNGYGVILAHPEKNSDIQGFPEYLFRLLNEFDPWQILVQIAAESILGRGGFSAKRTAKILLEHNLVHLIASDAHSSTGRPPRLSVAVELVGRIVGMDRARQIVGTVPRAVIGIEDEFPEVWEPLNPRRWWRVL